MRFAPLPEHFYAREGIPEFPVLSLTKVEERRILYSIVRHWYQGKGDIADLGSYLGGTAYPMALGLRDNPRLEEVQRLGRIHCYGMYGDLSVHGRFPADAVARLVPPGTKHDLELLYHTLAPFKDYINVYPGDFMKLNWPGAPIEIAHIDIAKSRKLWAHSWDVIQRYGLVGDTICIQQDFGVSKLPWLTYGLAVLAPYIEIYDAVVRGALYFRLVAAPPAAINAKIAKDDFTMQERLDLIAQMSELVSANTRSVGLPHSFIEETARLKSAYCHFWFGDKRDALPMLEGFSPKFEELHQKYFAEFHAA
jgi:hypothetical protein